MSERRTALRKPLVMYLDVVERPNWQFIGYLGDISETGLMFLTDQKIEIGKHKALTIMLPDTFNLPNYTMLDVDVETCWSKPDLNKHFQCIGCCFTDNSPSNADVIHAMTKQLGFAGNFVVQRVSDETVRDE